MKCGKKNDDKQYLCDKLDAKFKYIHKFS